MRILGIILVVVGLVVLYFGINASHAVSEKVVEGFSGRYTSTTMWYILGGTGLLASGAALLFFNRTKC
jgi:LPXTG-motif cell wall-anchored protein